MKDVTYYQNLPYTYEIRPFVEEGKTIYRGRIREFDGCMTHGERADDVYRELQAILVDHIEIKLAMGDFIPEPLADDVRYIGISPTLYFRLWHKAIPHGLTIDDYVERSLQQEFPPSTTNK